MKSSRRISGLAIATAITFLCFTASGQYFEVTGFGGYFFGGKKSYQGLTADISNSADFGLMAGVEIAPGLQVELSYTRANTEIALSDFDSGQSDQFDLSVNYYQLGATGTLETGKALKPYGTISIGGTLFAPKTNEYEDLNRFSMTLGGGIKFFFNEKIGLRLGGRLLLPMNFSGGGLWCGIGTGGTGCSVGVNAWGGITQGDLHGGLIFAFGKRD